uniref:Uncharacterized protein n=1 Tax=Anguilla anguilla TaxID=7936 RepID=A0A0E9SU22_ANGAN
MSQHTGLTPALLQTEL